MTLISGDLGDRSFTLQHGSKTSHFIQSLLNGARRSLVEFSVPSTRTFSLVPRNFMNIILPSTIKKLELTCELESSSLDILIKNRLSGLTSLAVMVSDVPFTNGLLFSVLENVRTTLCDLEIRGTLSSLTLSEDVTTYIRFPVMEKLKKFCTNSIYCELEAGQTCLEMCFPQLSVLQLRYQTENMFKKWTEGSKFTTVKNLTVSIVNDRISYDDDQCVVDFNFEKMNSVKMSFPNVLRLEMAINGKDLSGLRYLFMGMRQLTFLKIRVVGSSTDLNSDLWDGLLIGEAVYSLGTSQGIKGNVSSIKDLTCLKTLSLEADYHTNKSANKPLPLISDLAFDLALLRMPSLKKLILKGKFLVSERASQLFSSQGRTIYS